MIDLERYLYDRVKSIFDTWTDPEIYAVSFFVYSNEMNEYRDSENVTFFYVGYNTEPQCQGAGPHSEMRWNYAFWLQNDVPVMESCAAPEGMEVLFDWYAQEGIAPIGDEDETMEGPVGFPELTGVLSRVARRFQEEGYFLSRLGKAIPIIIHDLEYCDCVMEATAYANPNGEASDFFVDWEDPPADYDGPAFHITGGMDALMEQLRELACASNLEETDQITKRLLEGLQ